jgi:hypothetical protein
MSLDDMEYRKLSRIEELSEDSLHWRKELMEDIRDLKKSLRYLFMMVGAIFGVICIPVILSRLGF